MTSAQVRAMLVWVGVLFVVGTFLISVYIWGYATVAFGLTFAVAAFVIAVVGSVWHDYKERVNGSNSNDQDKPTS